MSIASPANVGRSARRRPVRSAWLGLLAWNAVVVALGAPPFRPAPKFEGKQIPEPPNQGQAWTPPATPLPKFLVNATASLFDDGVPDPRGCAYRQVEISHHSIVNAHGFVLPERADTPGRFVICWDGLVYPVVTVGEPADLDRDIKDLATSLKRAREARPSDRFGPFVYWSFPSDDQNPYSLAGVANHSPIKLCLLLRLGRADLAEALFAAGTSWTPKPRTRDLTDYRISYLTLAGDWAGSAYTRLVHAHERGDDVIALDIVRRLVKFRDRTDAKASALGFPRAARPAQAGAGLAPRFYFLGQLDDLLRDQERRAMMPARGPIPKKGDDPTARIAALIRDLDQIDERQTSLPGAAYPGGSPRVQDLAAEGDPAVAPLLEVLESDNRLTRSVSLSRDDSIERFVHPVYEAAFTALTGILRTGQFSNQAPIEWKTLDPAARKALAGAMRQYWEKTRSNTTPGDGRQKPALRD